MTTLSNFYEQLCAIYKHECVNYNEKAFRTKGVQTSRYQSYKSLPNIHTIFIQLLATTRKDFFDKVNKLSIYPPSALNVMLWNIWTISNCCWWGCHSKKITNPNKILTISPPATCPVLVFPFHRAPTRTGQGFWNQKLSWDTKILFDSWRKTYQDSSAIVVFWFLKQTKKVNAKAQIVAFFPKSCAVSC